MKDIFTMDEMITIVMAIVDNLEFKELYGLYEDQEINIPRPINEKIENLNQCEYQNFIEKMTEIAEEVMIIKSGELNELNRCHEEIIF
ncbi:hypothetical protein [Clostridium saccharobutylicum]|nr:hypothetical protein [Clostridium saccharobutylicum]